MPWDNTELNLGTLTIQDNNISLSFKSLFNEPQSIMVCHHHPIFPILHFSNLNILQTVLYSSFPTFLAIGPSTHYHPISCQIPIKIVQILFGPSTKVLTNHFLTPKSSVTTTTLFLFFKTLLSKKFPRISLYLDKFEYLKTWLFL